MPDTQQITIERAYATSAQEVWDLWTTKEGIESWWAPDGFFVEVQELDLRTGGELLYTMTATGPEQVAFLERAGMPLTAPARKTYTELAEPKRIAYLSLIDYDPGVEAYEHLTVVDLEPTEDGVRAIMTVEPMHDDEWTRRLVMGRENELENLGRLIAAPGRRS